MQSIAKELSRAKILMMGKKGALFFSTICLALETIVDDTIPTAATNGAWIKFNPEFFLKLTEEERIFVIAHETLHVVFMHMTRRGNKDARLWNVAGDYVINAALRQQGFTLIKGVLYDKRFEGMTTDEVYKILDSEGSQEEPQFDDVEDLGDLPPEQLKEAQSKIEGIVIRAKTLSEISGEPIRSDGINRLLSDLLKPKLPWQSILRKQLSAKLTRADYSWKKPKTRGAIMLPTLRSPMVGQLDVAIDVSGSVAPDDFNSFMAELFGIIKSVKPECINVTQFDHQLQGNQQIKTLRDLQRVPFKGGGGTLASVAYKAFATNSKSQLMVIITDGGICPRDRIPTNEKRPVIWVIYDNKNFVAPNPNEKVIHFSLN